MKLSVLMPVLNEERSVARAIKRVLDVPFPCEFELVVVDDGSTDRTAEELARFDDPRLILRRHESNGGKGCAVRTAAAAATGDYMVICDADLEYRPEELPELLAPVIEGEAEVVFGTRTFGSHTAYSLWYVVGNRLVTMAANVLFNCYLGDLETCYKLLPVALFRSLDTRATGFGIEAELTAQLLRRGIRPYEVPISYRARSRADGKKLTWRDGLGALAILVRARLQRPLRDPGSARGR